MLGAIVGVGLVLGLTYALTGNGGSRRRSPRSRVRDTAPNVRDVCTLTTRQLADGRFPEADLARWVRCDGRTMDDVARAARQLRATGQNDGATYIEGLWNVEGQGDVFVNRVAGAAPAPEAEAPISTRMPPRDYAAARRMVGALTSALRRRENYKRVLALFQAAAGITPTGRYDVLTANAIRYFGGQPPKPWHHGGSDAAFEPVEGEA
jgi:hypothetical protein